MARSSPDEEVAKMSGLWGACDRGELDRVMELVEQVKYLNTKMFNCFNV